MNTFKKEIKNVCKLNIIKFGATIIAPILMVA